MDFRSRDFGLRGEAAMPSRAAGKRTMPHYRVAPSPRKALGKAAILTPS
jgi:hypothetical protein